MQALLFAVLLGTSSITYAGPNDAYELSKCAGTYVALSGLHASAGNTKEANGYARLGFAFYATAQEYLPKEIVSSTANDQIQFLRRGWQTNNPSITGFVQQQVHDCPNLGRANNVGKYMK